MCHYHYYEVGAGPIKGLHLPHATWAVLRREGITTIHQLKAVANRIEQFDGIGPKTAQIIRDELARLASQPEDRSPHFIRERSR